MVKLVVLAAAELATGSSRRSRACTAGPLGSGAEHAPLGPRSVAPELPRSLSEFDHPGNAVSFEPTARNWVNLARLHAAKGQSALANDAMGKAKSLGGI